MGRCPPAAGARYRLDAAEVFVEPQVEIDALHLAVGDAVEARAELIVDGQPHGIAHGLIAIGRPEQVGMFFDVGGEFLEPAGERPASDHGGRNDEIGHFRLRPGGLTRPRAHGSFCSERSTMKRGVLRAGGP